MIQSKNHFRRLPIDNTGATFFGPAVLAKVSIPSVNIRPGKNRNPDWDTLVVPQPYNAGQGDSRVYLDPVVFLGDR